MNVAAGERESKQRHPERFCPERRCLWRTGGGYCPRHQRRQPMDEKELELEQVIETRNRLYRVTERAREEHREALEAYLAAGGTYPELSRLLGVSRQAVRQYVERGRKS